MTTKTLRAAFLVVALFRATCGIAADFATPGGPLPTNLDEISRVLHEEPYELELLISFGTSKGGSAGHLALAVRDGAPADDLVYSANFYADRDPAHDRDFYTDDLMVRVPKMEYLFGTTSSLGAKASFGLDFGEIYKRSVVGVRVFGVPAGEKEALTAYFRRINDDYHARTRDPEYHDGEVKYDYMRLNCAKTIGSAFKFGARYEDLEITSAKLLTRRRVVVAAKANIPTEIAMKLVREWDKRGYAMDVVLYKKYAGSTHVDPHEEEKVAFKDLPNRFPSVLSRDFRREEGQYRDFDNLFAMYLLHNMARYRVQVNEQTSLLEIEKSRNTMAYPEAAELAARTARSASDLFRRNPASRPSGTQPGEAPDDTRNFEDPQSVDNNSGNVQAH